jgi:hypothetical protein
MTIAEPNGLKSTSKLKSIVWLNKGNIEKNTLRKTGLLRESAEQSNELMAGRNTPKPKY